jgi:hypothetical protein
MALSEKTFSNDSKSLLSIGLQMCIDLADYLETKKVCFACASGHETTLSRTSFKNKLAKSKDNLCTECKLNDESISRFETHRDKILTTTGHRLLSLDENRKITYECGTCGTTNHSYLSNITKKDTTRFCHACINANTTKKTSESVRRELDEAGLANYQLTKYEGNKRVHLKCPLGHEFVCAMNDLISRDRRCPDCAGTRRKETNVEKYGVENAAAAPEIKAKIEKTLNDKYGGHHMKLKRVQAKRDETMMAKYDGLQFAFRSEAALENGRAVCQEKYGAPFPLQAPIIKEKMKENSRAKFGTDHPMQNAKEFERRQRVWRKYKFTSGREVRVQGYEPEFIDELLKRGVDESDIITERCRMPEIRYDWSEEKDGQTIEHKNSVYFPDMRVGDRLYEVKSGWTYESQKTRNLAKFEACKAQGYELDVVIYKNNKVITDTLEYRPEIAKRIEIKTPDASPVSTEIADRYERKRFEEYKARVMERNEHILLEINGKKAIYECGSCGTQNEKMLETILKQNGSKRCMKCTDKRNRPSRKTKESAQMELDAIGLSSFTIKLYTTAVDITVQCEHGHAFKSRLNDLIRRRKCPQC